MNDQTQTSILVALVSALIITLVGIVGYAVKRWVDRVDARQAASDQAAEERQEAFKTALDEHRRASEAALKELRSEFKVDMAQLRASTDTALTALNTTMAGIAKTAGDIRALMAERYATKDELSALEERLEKRFELCQSTCPPRCGT